MSNVPLALEEIPAAVKFAVSPEQLPVEDEHSHLLHNTAGDELCFWGIERLLTYHYVRRILFAEGHVTPEVFYSWSLREQADFVWQKLFVNRLSDCTDEGRKGVILVMQCFGLDPNAKNLDQAREFYREQTAEMIQQKSMKIAGVTRVVGTQDILDPAEVAFYQTKNCGFNQELRPAIRLDELLLHWLRAIPKFAEYGVDLHKDPKNEQNHDKLRKFLAETFEMLGGDIAYLASSFGPSDDPSNTQTAKGILLIE